MIKFNYGEKYVAFVKLTLKDVTFINVIFGHFAKTPTNGNT